MKLVAEEQHIDYHFSGLEDDDDGEIEDEDDAAAPDDDDGHYDNSCFRRDDGELSFEYGRADHAQVHKLTSRHSMEVSVYSCRTRGTLFTCLLS